MTNPVLEDDVVERLIAKGFMAGMKYAEQIVRWRDGVGTSPAMANEIKGHIDGGYMINGETGPEAADTFARALLQGDKKE